jgi:hypothetical protein
VSLRGDLRAALVDVPHFADLVAKRMAVNAGADLCPHCGFRPVRVAATGTCVVCHLNEVLAQRELWRIRQELKRARSAAS